MTILTAYQVVNAWTTAGGPRNRAVAWAAVSFAESSWDTLATSYTYAHGLWQIEPGSWPPGAGPGSDWPDPDANALAAVILSGGGMNFAPWDTAYANIGATGRYAYLAWPEPGSAAANNMGMVQGEVGGTYYGTSTAPEMPGLTGTLPDAIAWYADVSNAVLPAMTTRARGVSAAARKLY